MTKEEAIRCLNVHSSTNGSGLCTDKQHYEAKQMAIKALEQEPKTGHWIYKQYGGYPECGNWHCSACDEIDNRTSAYCPNCGCHMVEPQERSDKE